MDFLDLIVALLFVLIPFAGKLIDKRLKKSAGTSKKVSAEEWKEILSETLREMRDEKAGEHEEVEEAEPVPSGQEKIVTEVVEEPAAVRTVPEASDVLLKDDAGKKKIDPKKLVIYSEIMTPKFRD